MRRMAVRLAKATGSLWCWFETSRVGSGLFYAFRQGYWLRKLGRFGVDSHIFRNVVIHNPKNVKIGDRVTMAEFVHIWGGGGVDIGSDVAIASHSVITSQTHDKNAVLFRSTQLMMPVKIEDNVWIGSGAIILPGVKIGEGSVIGAHSVVTRDVPPGSLVMGVPARVVQQL